MKAVGGDETDTQRLFLAESMIIGCLGMTVGLLFGYGLTRGMNAVAGIYLRRLGIAGLDLFHYPSYLVSGIIAVTILVSLLAGYFPARRAERIQPFDALRHT